MREFHKTIHIDKNMEECLWAMLASLKFGTARRPALDFPGRAARCRQDALPPFFRRAGNRHFVSNLTPHVLVSGFKGEDDPSLIPQLRDKCLILNNYTEVRSLDKGSQEAIYGVLRGAYDGDASRPFGQRRRP